MGALDSVDYFADGELRCLVATEDTDKSALKAVLWSDDFVEDDTEVVSYGGCSKVDAALVLGSFLAEKARHVRLAVHRDRDYLGEGKVTAFEGRLSQQGIRPLVTQGNDIESYFLSAEHLSSLNPLVSVARVQELLDRATQEAREKSLTLLINTRTEEAFKNRRTGGAQPNHGEIAIQAAADYDANPIDYRRGKIVLGRLNALLQQETGQNPHIFAPSPHLRHQHITDIAHQIWPPEAGDKPQ